LEQDQKQNKKNINEMYLISLGFKMAAKNT